MASRPPLLITGGDGEIGSALRALFADMGQPLLALDAFLAAADPGPCPRRLLHLAARADECDPAALIRSNVDYLAQTLATAEALGVEEIIFFSSASVYGAADDEDIGEDHCLRAPGLYGASKLLGERLVASSPLRSLCLRLPGVLELRKASNFVTRSFERLHRGERISITNGQRLFNHFLYLPDLAVFLAAVELRRPHDVINLAAPRQLTVHALMTLLRDELHSPSPIEASPGGGPFFSLSIDKAMAQYGYRPSAAAHVLRRWCRDRLALREDRHVRTA